MDPSIMKKLLEDDEDESMHSGADVEAFQAALNRDIGGDASASHPSEPGSEVLSQGSSNTSTQSLPQFPVATQDESANYRIQQDQNSAQPQTVNSSEQEQVKHGSVPENMQQQQQQQQHNNNNTSQEPKDLGLPPMPSQDERQQKHSEQNPLHTSQATGMQMSGKAPVLMQEPERPPPPDNESQYVKLQKMSNQQATVSDQPTNPPAGRTKQVPFGLLLPVLMNQLDKDKGMQLQELFGKLKKEEITKESFVRLIRGVVGEQVLKLAVLTVQSQSQASVRKQPQGVPSVNTGATQFTDPRSFAQVHQKGTSSSADVSHIPASRGQLQTNPSHQIMDKSVQMLREGDRQSDFHGKLANQMPLSTVVTTNQERDSMQHGFKRQQQQHQQQQLHFPQTSFSSYGNNGSRSHLFSGTNANTSTLSVKSQPHDSQMRQISQHQSMGSAQSGGETHGVNVMGVSKLERQNVMNDPSRMHGGSLSHFANNSTIQQNLVPWQPPTNKDQSAGPLSSMSYVKPEPVEQAIELQHKTASSSQGSPSVSAAQFEQRNTFSGTLRDESLEKQPSRMGFPTSAGVVPSLSTSMAPPHSLSSSMPMQPDPSVPLGARAPSGLSPAGVSNKTPPKKPSLGQKKPLEALGSSPPPAGKKQKVSGNFSDQSIEQLNDVTAVSGVNLREEEEQLFSVPKEDSRVSEASRKAVQEEEERLILQKIPLQKKLAEIMAKCGLKNISNDVERCLSLSVEERMRGLIENLIRMSKQRADSEKARHQTITTSDIRRQIMMMNLKAREEWEKKQAEAEKLRKENEPENNNGVDGEKEKDEGRSKSLKGQPNKEEDDKLRTTAANVAARAAVGGDDMLSKWQLMAEQARQKREGGTDAASGSQPGKDVSRKTSSTPGRTTKDHHEAEKRSGTAFFASSGGRKFGRNQGVSPQTKVPRGNITIKDVIAVLEREPQMSRSTLIYRSYEKVRSDAAAE
ncbi:transcription initiation factor TFIID subunit 4b isoform X2 [Humulus lupulus]|uniref:transcription initiation factor TFIID subunit 4b isoform X2 n=1 Tax=Humulus lupulus TaxID=3486 RepID=UPI002B40B009|nr:transcription initiation factor TFIID subunit 4b isoform X2 [Humulus lupulus]